MRIAQSICQHLDFRLSKFPPTAEPIEPKTTVSMSTSGSTLRNAPANDENKGGGNDERGGNVAGACVNGRRNRRRQARIQHALDAKTQPGDDPPRRVDNRGNAR